MNTNNAFYKHIVPLSMEDHAECKILENANYKFAADTSAVYLTSTEFSQASKVFPIVFVEQDDQIQPAAVLGLEKHHNVFVTDRGSWTAKYIPAYIRRYPFILAEVQQPEQDWIVCIDDQSAVLNKEQGVDLFHSGSVSEYTKSKINFLKTFQQASEDTNTFCKHIKALNLLEPMNAQIKMNKGDDLSVTGFMVISKAQLQKLTEKQLKELITNDYMMLLYEHLSSLTNFSVLVDKIAAQRIIEGQSSYE
ncbi:SapC family protein [Zooshikella harenae]|uniref:SapC family protein n=1 Tax=Zooshikella harenae TaxID=2827238 RepID=A0ABS5Z950_9GAMM|nr:SapC family protein [Zooshikella harenae]MBU2710574.1 SapC family protein [Zooshikella harenae]